jgi:hypothetical protein
MAQPGVQPPPAGVPGATRPPRGKAVPILAVLTVLLVVALGAVAVVTMNSLNSLNKDLTTAKKQADTDSAERQQASAKAAASVDVAALKTKYEAVKTADKTAADAVKAWANVNGTKFGTVISAIEKCYRAADDYDRAAAPAAADALGGLPVKVDINNPQTDCSRTSLSSL